MVKTCEDQFLHKLDVSRTRLLDSQNITTYFINGSIFTKLKICNTGTFCLLQIARAWHATPLMADGVLNVNGHTFSVTLAALRPEGWKYFPPFKNIPCKDRFCRRHTTFHLDSHTLSQLQSIINKFGYYSCHICNSGPSWPQLANAYRMQSCRNVSLKGIQRGDLLSTARKLVKKSAFGFAVVDYS